MKIFQSTGEWKYEDLIYVKNQGTKEHEHQPIGWMMIEEEKINFKWKHQPGAQVWFMQYDETNEILGEVLWEATAELTLSGDIKISNMSKYTKTYIYTGDTTLILKKLSD